MKQEEGQVELSEKKGSMAISKKGSFELRSVEDQLKYAKYLMDNGLISDTFKKPSQAVIAIQALKDLDLPNSCIKDFYCISGRPAVYGDTFLGLMMGSGMVEEFQVQFFDEKGIAIQFPTKGQNYFGCAITARRKGQSLNSTISYTFDDKELTKNNNPTWGKSPRDMLFRRAAGRVAKWLFADAIRGIEMVDYLEDVNQSSDEKNIDGFRASFVKIKTHSLLSPIVGP